MCFNSNYVLLISYYMQGYVLIMSHVLHQSILTTDSGRYYYYHPRLTNEETIGKVGADLFNKYLLITTNMQGDKVLNNNKKYFSSQSLYSSSRR